MYEKLQFLKCYSQTFACIILKNGQTYFENLALFTFFSIIHRKVNVEAVSVRCSIKKVFLKISQDSLENTRVGVSFLIRLQACNFIKKETATQVFSCKFCKIFKNIFFFRTPPGAPFEASTVFHKGLHTITVSSSNYLQICWSMFHSQLTLKLMNHDINNVGKPTLFRRAKSIEKILRKDKY